MEITFIAENLPLRCAWVETFPMGIKEAFDKLMADFSPVPTRNYYGISWMDENCNIVYKVATNIIESSEFKIPGYEEYLIPKGNYLTETISDWMQQLPKIKETFGKMMTDPGFDSKSACVEWYIDDEKMICMAKLIGDGEKIRK